MYKPPAFSVMPAMYPVNSVVYLILRSGADCYFNKDDNTCGYSTRYSIDGLTWGEAYKQEILGMDMYVNLSCKTRVKIKCPYHIIKKVTKLRLCK